LSYGFPTRKQYFFKWQQKALKAELAQFKKINLLVLAEQKFENDLINLTHGCLYSD
jgi:hypothetical protein